MARKADPRQEPDRPSPQVRPGPVLWCGPTCRPFLIAYPRIVILPDPVPPFTGGTFSLHLLARRGGLKRPLIHSLDIRLQRVACLGAEIEHMAAGISFDHDRTCSFERWELVHEKGGLEIGRDQVGIARGNKH